MPTKGKPIMIGSGVGALGMCAASMSIVLALIFILAVASGAVP